MSKICITIPDECKSCYKLCIEYCPTGINIQPKLNPDTKYYLFVVDHFGNVWRDDITINQDGSFDIDLANYPSGFFTSSSGAVNIFLSENEDGSNPIDMTFDGTVYNCVLISTQPNVDFVDEDVTIFNPGVSSCGVIPGWTVVWGNIEGDILNQTDLIEYIANATTGYITCEDLPDCQTIIDINNTLAGKFDIPTGTASDYLDGTGAPTPFPSIPAQYNPSAGTGISITGAYPNQTITNTDPDQIVVLTGGTAILITGTYPNFTIDNLSPDQIVALNNGTGISVSGTYPNFTIDNTLPDQVVNLSNGTGISITGTYPNFTITNSNPDQTVSLTAGSGISITGTYPNFTITSTVTGTVTSVTASSPLFSSGGTTPNITIQQANGSQSGFLSSSDFTTFNNKVTSISAGTGISIGGTTTVPIVTNTAPDQTVSLTAGTGISVSGTYPSFTITNTSTSGGLKSGIATASVTDIYTTTISGVTAYTTNDAYVIKFNTANSNGATININGLGAVQLAKNNNFILTGGDISVGQEFIIIYDGTNFQMLGIAPNQMFAYVTNADSVTINKGQPVYAFGASGDRMSVKLANNTTEATSSKTIGLVFSSSIAPGGLGFVITQGVLLNVNTGAFSPGDTLYVGASAGALVNTMPFAPNHLTRIGIVERANAGNGLIYVFVQNGFQLDELSDVDITTVLPVNNDVLTYVTGSPDLWKPRSISSILGYTPLANNNWVDYSTISTFTGWSSFFTKELRYKIVGDIIFVKYFINGVSNTYVANFTLPIVTTNFLTENNCRTGNNSISYNGFFNIIGISNLVNFYYWTTASAYQTVWTSSNSKLLSGEFFAEIGTTTLDFDAQTFISWAGITDATQKSAINQLVLDLKAYGLWTKTQAIYPVVGGTATTHSYNLKNPTLYQLTFTAGWTHSSTGMAPNGTSAYANTFFSTSMLALNSVHLGFYSRTNSVNGGSDMGALQNSPNSYTDLSLNQTGFACFTRINSNGLPTSVANADTRGFYVGNRTASNVLKLFKNSNIILTSADVSNATSTRGIFISGVNNAGTPSLYSNRQCAFASIGDGLTDTEAANFYTAVQAFQTTLGRQV